MQTTTREFEVVARRSALPPQFVGERSDRTVGDWEFAELVARGPLSWIYRARPAGRGCAGAPHILPPSYAIKIVAPRGANPIHAADVVRREVWVSREAAHPNLVAVLATHLSEPPEFLVMPWLRGATLAEHARRRRLPVNVVLWLTRQVAEALATLDAAGWMHADIKPNNVMVSPEGHATLIDLGFARRPGEATSSIDHAMVGTAQYMAPEMITSTLRPDIRSDIYSLGVTLFELLCGRRPYRGGGVAEMARQHRQEEPLELRALVPTLPSDVARLVHEMIAKEPLRRPQTPRELIERLVNLEISAVEAFDVSLI